MNIKVLYLQTSSSATVCTPYDSRMIDKKELLHKKIRERTERAMKKRLESYKTDK